jgi:hypothetical protein
MWLHTFASVHNSVLWHNGKDVPDRQFQILQASSMVDCGVLAIWWALDPCPLIVSSDSEYRRECITFPSYWRRRMLKNAFDDEGVHERISETVAAVVLEGIIARETLKLLACSAGISRGAQTTHLGKPTLQRRNSRF